MCLQNLKRRKLRTLLTSLGVVIGCCAIVIMESIGIGMRESQEKMLAEMGDLTIIEVSAPQQGKGKKKLDDKIVKELRGIRGVEVVTPKKSLNEYTIKLYAGIGNRYVAEWSSVVGLDMNEMESIGYTLTEGENVKKRKEIIVGQYFAYNFKDTLRLEGMNMVDRYTGGFDENGEIMNIPKPYFNVLKEEITLEIEADSKKMCFKMKPVGVVKEDYSKGFETSDGVIMNLSDLIEVLNTVQGNKTKKTVYDSILVKVKDISAVEAVEKEIRNKGYNTESMESIRKPMEKDARQKQMMLGGLGAISLFVAALGITNTMIMSISERTKEIGIMKSLGCYVDDIRIMFLLEAGIIGLLGGVVGCLISLILSVSMNMLSLGGVSLEKLFVSVVGAEGSTRMSIIPIWLLGFAVVFSVLIGIGSGYYPANKAVKIPALEAIKSD